MTTKSFVFLGTQRLLLLEKNRCECSGVGGVGVGTSSEIPQAERSIHETNTVHI